MIEKDYRSYAQAIKGNEAFTERVLRAAGRDPVARMDLTGRDVASVVGKAGGFFRRRTRQREPAPPALESENASAPTYEAGPRHVSATADAQ